MPEAFGSAQSSQQETSPNRQRAASLEPRASSPIFAVDVTPLKPRKGRPAYTPGTRRLKKTVQKLRSSNHSPDKRRVNAAQLELQRKAAEGNSGQGANGFAGGSREETSESSCCDTGSKRGCRSASTARDRRDPVLHGPLAYRFRGRPTDTRIISKYVKDHGLAHATNMFQRAPETKQQLISQEMAKILEREGRAIQALLTREWTTSIMDLLKEFSMDQLATELQAKAPHMWAALTVLAEPDQSTRREDDGENRRNKGLVFTTVFALISVLRSQKANNFQLVIVRITTKKKNLRGDNRELWRERTGAQRWADEGLQREWELNSGGKTKAGYWKMHADATVEKRCRVW
ncbi:hypothetical protein B0H14DRAFT_2586326 [Mycena olivaceomarginata]|nr:hypothetical protein B0H14DRAFT_2586326 [Mycena olivaceomarginata]